MNQYILVLAYGVTIVASTLAGGYLPWIFRIDHVRMQLTLSFVGGMMLGVALLILLPHGYLAINVALANPGLSITYSVNACLIGLLLTFFMMRAFHFHQHVEEHHGRDEESRHGREPGHGHEPRHVHATGHAHHHQDVETPKTRLGWLGVGFGLGLHTFMDGMALGSAVQQDGSMMGGFAVYLAILMHKPLDALSLSTVMAREQFSWKFIQCANVAFGLMCLIGALTALWLGVTLGGLWMGCLMSAAAGVFLCISLSDLLPEVQFHRHHRWQLSLAMLCGIAIAFIVERLHVHG